MDPTPEEIRQVGDLVVVGLPPEILADSGLHVGDPVMIRSELGRIEVTPAPPANLGLAGFAARFMDRYRGDLARLADL